MHPAGAGRREVRSPTVSHERLWGYARLSRLWARTLIVVGGLLFVLGAALEVGDPDGDLAGWLLTAAVTTVPTTVLFFFLLRSWMRSGALPSGRLPEATRDTGKPRRLEASPGDWRRWSAVLGVCMFVAAAALTGFLVGILGGGGEAEGVVIGVLIAWGIVTARDVRVVDATQAAEGRVYYAACRRPVSVGQRLVWRSEGS